MIRVDEVQKKYKKKEFSLWSLLTKSSEIQKQENWMLALSDITFRVDRPESIGIVGPNGSGKSTLIKILCGILKPDEGQVEILGLRPWKDRIDYVRHIGYLAGQRSFLLPDLSIYDSYEYLRRIYGVDKSFWNQRVKELSARFRTLEYLDRPLRTLSLGNRVKVSLVASILHNPKILFLDEPTIGVDWESKDEIRAFLRDYAQEQKSQLFICSHDFEDLESLCERFLILKSGRLVKDSSARDVGVGDLGLKAALKAL